MKLDAIVERARTLASNITDPEIPVITIEELGILRSVQAVPMALESGDSQGYIIEITLTPTYSGCPAIDQIRDDILNEMDAEDIPARVKTQLAPAWTTDWMSEAAKDKLRAYGIAPPQCAAPATSSHPSPQPSPPGRGSEFPLSPGERAGVRDSVIQFTAKKIANSSINTAATDIFSSQSIICPQCGSDNTTETSHFASTACKALYKCLNCLEPFDYFKPY